MLTDNIRKYWNENAKLQLSSMPVRIDDVMPYVV